MIDLWIFGYLMLHAFCLVTHSMLILHIGKKYACSISLDPGLMFLFLVFLACLTVIFVICHIFALRIESFVIALSNDNSYLISRFGCVRAVHGCQRYD